MEFKLCELACQLCKKEALAQVFSCEFCEISKKTFSCRTPPVAASVLMIILSLTIFINLATCAPFYVNSKNITQDISKLNRSKLFEDRVFTRQPGEKFKLSYYPNNSDSKFANYCKASIALKLFTVYIG